MPAPLSEPTAPDPAFPRYSSRPFPPYRFVPTLNAHPCAHPEGHSYEPPGTPPHRPPLLPPERWQECETYLFGVDLYNFAYWWESHEVFEAFWHAAGPRTEQGQFFQGLIQLAAGNLKQFMGNEAAASNLFRSSARRFSGLPDHYMGIAVADLRARLHQEYAGNFVLRLELRGLT